MTPVLLARAAEGRTYRLSLTVDGLRSMLQDMRAAQLQIPKMIVVSERDRRDLNQDLLGGSIVEVAKDDQRPEHDGQCIGMIEGVMIASHESISHGKARLVY